MNSEDIKLIQSIKEEVKKSDAVIKKYQEYGVSIDEIDETPVYFSDGLPVSARTQHAIIALNSRLRSTPEEIGHYLSHELVHVLQQTTGSKPTKGSADDEDYLNNEFEIEGFQAQTEYIKENEGEEEAEDYIDQVLDHHDVEGKEYDEKKKELLSSEASIDDESLEKTLEKYIARGTISQRDAADAVEHLTDFDDPDKYNFSSEVVNGGVEFIENYDDLSWIDIEPGSLIGLNKEEFIENLSSFRGRKWAERAWEIKDNIPTIIIIETPNSSGVCDGRGRTNLAYGLGIKIPMLILTGEYKSSFDKESEERISSLQKIAGILKVPENILDEAASWTIGVFSNTIVKILRETRNITGLLSFSQGQTFDKASSLIRPDSTSFFQSFEVDKFPYITKINPNFKATINVKIRMNTSDGDPWGQWNEDSKTITINIANKVIVAGVSSYKSFIANINEIERTIRHELQHGMQSMLKSFLEEENDYVRGLPIKKKKKDYQDGNVDYFYSPIVSNEDNTVVNFLNENDEELDNESFKDDEKTSPGMPYLEEISHQLMDFEFYPNLADHISAFIEKVSSDDLSPRQVLLLVKHIVNFDSQIKWTDLLRDPEDSLSEEQIFYLDKLTAYLNDIVKTFQSLFRNLYQLDADPNKIKYHKAVREFYKEVSHLFSEEKAASNNNLSLLQKIARSIPVSEKAFKQVSSWLISYYSSKVLESLISQASNPEDSEIFQYISSSPDFQLVINKQAIAIIEKAKTEGSFEFSMIQMEDGSFSSRTLEKTSDLQIIDENYIYLNPIEETKNFELTLGYKSSTSRIVTEMEAYLQIYSYLNHHLDVIQRFLKKTGLSPRNLLEFSEIAQECQKLISEEPQLEKTIYLQNQDFGPEFQSKKQILEEIFCQIVTTRKGQEDIYGGDWGGLAQQFTDGGLTISFSISPKNILEGTESRSKFLATVNSFKDVARHELQHIQQFIGKKNLEVNYGYPFKNQDSNQHLPILTQDSKNLGENLTYLENDLEFYPNLEDKISSFNRITKSYPRNFKLLLIGKCLDAKEVTGEDLEKHLKIRDQKEKENLLNQIEETVNHIQTFFKNLQLISMDKYNKAAKEFYKATSSP